MLQIVEGAECNGALADIERDILLNELREAYTALKFGAVEVAHVEPKVEAAAEPVAPVLPVEEDEESEENEIEVELIFDESEDEEPIIEDEPVAEDEPVVAAPELEPEPEVEVQPEVAEPIVEEPIAEEVVEPTVEEAPEADEVVVYEAPAEDETEDEEIVEEAAARRYFLTWTEFYITPCLSMRKHGQRLCKQWGLSAKQESSMLTKGEQAKAL